MSSIICDQKWLSSTSKDLVQGINTLGIPPPWPTLEEVYLLDRVGLDALLSINPPCEANLNSINY